MHPDPLARLTHDSTMGNLLMGGRLNETPGTTSTERKLIPMERSNPSSHENENATRYSVVQPGTTQRYSSSIIIKAICNAQDPPSRPQMCCLAVRTYSCLYTMYHINNSVFSSVLKVVRLQSDIRNAVASYSTQKVRIQQSFYLRSMCLSLE